MKKILVTLTLLALAPTVALALPSFDRMKTKLNQNVVPSDGNLFRLGDQLTNKKAQVMKVTFDVSKTGATGYPQKYVGDHILLDVDGLYATIPSNAVIREAWIDIKSEVTSIAAAPRLSFKVQSAGDLKAGVSTLWYKTGPSAFKQILPIDGTTVMKMTADRIVYATVSGGALSGGTMNLFISYFLSD